MIKYRSVNKKIELFLKFIFVHLISLAMQYIKEMYIIRYNVIYFYIFVIFFDFSLIYVLLKHVQKMKFSWMYLYTPFL